MAFRHKIYINLELLVPLDQLDQLGYKVYKVLEVFKGFKEYRGPKEYAVFKELLALLE
jgi:hypothetical protein